MKSVIRLNDNERVFLATSCLSASASVKEIAQQIGLREHKVRHIRDSLLQRGVITPLYLIDTFRVGLTDFRLFLSDIHEPSKVRNAFEKLVLQHHQVYWLARMSGAYQYAITFLSRDPCQMIDFFAAVQPKPDGLYANKTISIAGDWTVFSPNFLAPEIKTRQAFHMTTRNKINPPEPQDERILEAMAKYPAASFATLARVCGIAPTTLSYRMERLTEMEVVRGQVYLINHQLLGVSVYRIMIVERGLAATERERLRKYIVNHPSVGAFLICTGGWDYELRFECTSPEAVDDFCQTIIDNFGDGVGTIRISQQVRTMKRVSYPVSCKSQG